MVKIAAESEILIARKQEVVFAYFADLRNEPVWNQGHVKNVVMTSPAPIGQGTTFEGEHAGFGKATWRITEYDPPKHVVIDGLVGGAPYRYVGDLKPQGDSTLFSGRIEWEPQGSWRLLGRLWSWILKFQAGRSFRNLRNALIRTTTEDEIKE